MERPPAPPVMGDTLANDKLLAALARVAPGLTDPQETKHKKVLDLGTGNGQRIPYLFPNSKLVGIDMAEQHKDFPCDATYIRQSFVAPTWDQRADGPFDLVTSFYGICYVPDENAFFADAIAKRLPKGVCILVAPAADNLAPIREALMSIPEVNARAQKMETNTLFQKAKRMREEFPRLAEELKTRGFTVNIAREDHSLSYPDEKSFKNWFRYNNNSPDPKTLPAAMLHFLFDAKEEESEPKWDRITGEVVQKLTFPLKANRVDLIILARK